MDNWYDDLTKVDEKLAPAPAETNWYDNLTQEEPKISLVASATPDAPLKSYEELSSKYLDKPPQISYLPTESDVEIIKHAGGGALAFFPAVASGLGEMIHQKGRNVLAAMAEGPHIGEKHTLEKKLAEAKSLPEYMEIHEKAMYEKARQELMIEQVKKSPQEIRDKVTDAMSIWTDWMEPPKTDRAKAYLQLMDITLNDMLFHQPHKLDKWLSKKGYPNVGWLAGIAGELTVLHGMKSAKKEFQAMPKKFNEFLKKIEKNVPKKDATLSKGPLLDEMVGKMEKTIEDHFEDIGIPKEAVTSPESLQAYIDKIYGESKGGALKGVTKSQKQRAHKIAKEKGLSEVERRDLAEQVTGQRSMMDMNRESAGRFVEALRKGEKSKKIADEKKPWEMGQDEWIEYAKKGKLHKATGKKIKGEEDAQTNIKMGELNNYSDQDIAHFYLERRTYADETRTPDLDKIAYEEYIKDARTEGKKRVKKVKTEGEIVEESPAGELVPKFKSTQEALLFGEKATAEQIVELKRLKEALFKESSVALKAKEFNKAMEKATESQFYREALEAVEKIPRALEDLKKIKDARKVKEDTQKAIEKTETIDVKEQYNKFLESVGKRYKAETKGQEILDNLEEGRITPTKVSEIFWKDTFYKLPAEAQKNIKNYLQSLTGMKPGDPIATLKGKAIEAKDWHDIARMLGDDFTKIEHLEGPERGYVSLMAYANEAVKIKKPTKPPVSELVKLAISDDLRIAEDMGIYASIKEMAGKKMKVGEVIRELKQKAYYKEDLKDFDYTEADIRRAIRAVKIDIGDKETISRLDTRIKRETKAAEKIEEIEIEPPSDIKRVDPETGRAAGVEVDLISRATQMDDITMQAKVAQLPITGASGKILKHRFAVERRLKELGQTGEVIENPKGDGWVLKKSKTQRDVEKRSSDAERETWEDVLKEEELDLIEEGLGKKEDSSILDIMADETGAIKIEPKQIKKLKDLVKRGIFSRDRVIKTLRERGASDENILAVFPDASVRVLNKAVESKWWKPGQDPLALLKRRVLPNKMKAPAVSRGEAHAIATMKDMPARLTAEHFSWENAVRTFEKLGPEIKETFYRSVKEGESLTFDRFTDLQKRARKIRRSVSYHKHKRIGVHQIAEQPDGLAVLAQQGITKIPKLKPKELKAYDDLRAIYDELFIAVNKARVASGEKPFPPVKNYATWIQDLNWLEKNEGIGLFSNWRTIESKMAEIKRVPGFKFAKFRGGPEMPRKLNLNPFETMEIYAKSASKYIEMAPKLAKLNELLTEQYGMQQNAPHAYNFLRHWLSHQAGKIPAWDIAHSKTRRAMQVLNSNIVFSLLSFTARSAIIQPTALASSYTMLGEYYMGVGVAQVLSPAKWKMAGKKSNVLNTRSPDTAIYEAMEASGKMPGQIKKAIATVGITPLVASDSVAARITWLGAYAKGMKKFKSDKQAVNYADDIVTKTQASAARSDIAPIQRTQLGKTVTCLQTFVINHWGFLTKDVMGIKNADVKNPVMVKRVLRFLLATTAVNMLFEDGLGLNSPNPTPIRAYREEFEKTGDTRAAYVRSVKEIAEYVPLWGGRLRYGSEVGGPVLTETLKLIEKGDPEALLKLMGIPGINQFFKMVRAHEKGGSDLDILLGRSVKEEPDLTAPIGRRGRYEEDLGAPIR